MRHHNIGGQMLSTKKLKEQIEFIKLTIENNTLACGLIHGCRNCPMYRKKKINRSCYASEFLDFTIKANDKTDNFLTFNDVFRLLLKKKTNQLQTRIKRQKDYLIYGGEN